MGASGSGKTTLIQSLNASTKYVISDDSRVYCSESQPIVKRLISQDQNDRLIDGLTVGEALSYSSKVNNSHYKGVKHEENITQLMTQLLINDINDTTIEKCSGGQRKRIAIALQLTSIEKPNLLFMDEPTTGLDSNAAFEV
ncbi:ATP-binding cassette sub-family G member 4-like [Oppia nitens]|uniref:ATP-binding cassette sub-family G member 4-like n=1 Tax=Oppia nitens TaxID=1686743 RepID=UPI0023DA2C78|nr:ATP-binding cassette sub-family G member 4-like [Oppia nitens]